MTYLKQDEEDRKFLVKEIFVEIIDCAEKTGEDFSQLIFDKLKEHGLQKKKFRVQGYDNGSNMNGLKAVKLRLWNSVTMPPFQHVLFTV